MRAGIGRTASPLPLRLDAEREQPRRPGSEIAFIALKDNRSEPVGLAEIFSRRTERFSTPHPALSSTEEEREKSANSAEIRLAHLAD
jgi:hypothetical protein